MDYSYYYYSNSSPTASIISLAYIVVSVIALWKLFKKAGYQGWEAIVPFYNLITLFKIAGLSPWYILLIFVPFANIYIIFKLYIELAHKFGKSTGFGVATVFFGIICLPIMAFDNNCVYIDNMNVGQQQMYNQQMYNQQMYNQQMYNQQMYSNQQMYNNQMNNNQMPNQQNNFCTSCGTKFTDNNSKFCTNCGKQRQ